MPRKSKNTFNREGNLIYITRPDWDFIATASVRDDYEAEMRSVTWGLNKDRYPHNARLGTLHSYVMKEWYGEDTCQKMKAEGFVIDHMDNNSTNSNISNLCFLSSDENKAKGMTVDKLSARHELIALSMYKDFDTGLFQTTIVFNYPAKLNVEGLEYPAFVELAYLLYDCDYELVINDAHSILLEYRKDYTFSPNLLRNIDYQIEGCYGTMIPVEQYIERKFQLGKPVCFFDKIAPIKEWTLSKKREFLHLSYI